MDLAWKEFNVNLADCEVQFKALGGAQYCGNQAHSVLELWFLEEQSQEEKDALTGYWDNLTDESDEAVNYQTGEQIKAAQEADKAAKLATASAKLEVLGLTAEEIQAIVGQ